MGQVNGKHNPRIVQSDTPFSFVNRVERRAVLQARTQCSRPLPNGVTVMLSGLLPLSSVPFVL
jgi:hypothetical protein